MRSACSPSKWNLRRLSLGLILALSLLGLAACQRQAEPAVTPATGWFGGVEALQGLDVSNAEIDELTRAREAGLSDQACVALIQLARSRQVPFTGGAAIAGLLTHGASEPTVLELAHLNQLGTWTGEAQAMLLAGIPEQVIIGVAQRRAQNLYVLPGAKLAEVKNVGASDAQLLNFVRTGVTEEQASYFINQQQRAAGGHSFVYQGRSRRRR